MKLLPELPGRGQRIMDVVFRIALLMLMAGVAVHAVVAETGGAEPRSADPSRQSSLLEPASR